ncbi:periodic tryptophan protein 2 homolog [Topomyia yanbarensis]|uniref:periodic tryptophan protein 2 homolog n=1 Tax=Topomyia yanbarensis TaxID=2498891 RepID=UPI00273B7BCE|nr:periodic tryptophan protein 2 homolog [Topomyia yanbarensis]
MVLFISVLLHVASVFVGNFTKFCNEQDFPSHKIMKFAYKFSNLLGSVYRKGKLIFTPDGNSVISPVGNRITIFDLKNNKSHTLTLESEYSYSALDLSPNGCVLVAVNEIGDAQMISMISYTVVHRYKFKTEVKHLRFSPDGQYFAACVGNAVLVFRAPGELGGTYNSFVVQRAFEIAYDETTFIDWACNSRILAVGSKDNSVRIQGVEYLNNFRPFILGGHRDAIVGCFFEEKSLDVNTVSKDGLLMIWECGTEVDDISTGYKKVGKEEPAFKKARDSDDEQEDDVVADQDYEKSDKDKDAAVEHVQGSFDKAEERDDLGRITVKKPKKHFTYKRLARHYLADEARKENPKAIVTSAAYHKHLKLLITAYSSGVFYLHELPDVTMIHSLSISDFRIETVTFNNTGDWLALGVPEVGQLLVWEWQSEQYVMKQQGHATGLNCVTYSPDGQLLATGGLDGKVKLWNINNGFCFVTFSEHSSSVTAVEFSGNKKFFVSASLDGTIRAYDIVRYRNFRTFTSPEPVQFASVAVDQSGELVAAGGQDVFEVYLWSMKLGRLLEVLSGHEGPVVTLAFSPVATSSAMVSGSWDKSIRIWDCLESSGSHETIDVGSDVVCVVFKPDGEEVAVSSLNGQITVFHVKTAQQVASIEGRNDMGGSVSATDLNTAEKNLQGRAFTSICYSADGECLLAGGKSKYVCIYNVREAILLKKFQITQNRSLDGIDEFLNRKNITEFGNIALVEERENLEGGNVTINLPGVKRGDLAARNLKPEVNVFAVRFSPSGKSWAAASTEGLLMYSLNKGIVFDPYQLSVEVTPKATRELLKKKDYSAALIMALKLNENNLIHEAMEQIPHTDAELVILSLPDEFAHRSLKFVAKMLTSSSHVEFYLRWSNLLLTRLGQCENVLTQPTLVLLHQNLNRKYESLNKICDFNKYTIQVLKNISISNRINGDHLKKSAQNGEYEDASDSELMLIDQSGSKIRENSDDSD